MKRVLTVAFSILMLCGILLLNTGISVVKATEPGYVIGEAYGATTKPTVDGIWTTGEWDDTTLNWIDYMNSTQNRFVYRMDSLTTGEYWMSWLLDFSDNTTDADDIWQLCIDGPVSGGTAPQTDHWKIEIQGHTTLKMYSGTGTGWVENASAPISSIRWNNSLTATGGVFNYPHWILEIQVNKGGLGAWGANPPPEAFRIAMFDASNASQGWIAWPPTSADVPDDWGLIGSYGSTIPESLSFGVVVLLSSVAVAVGFHWLRKRPKTERSSSAKTGEINYTP